MKAGGFRRLAPPGAALILALVTASGVAPRTAREGTGVLVAVDASPSCEPLEPMPAGALRDEAPDLAALLARAAAAAGSRRVLLYTDGCDARGMPAVPEGVTFDVGLRPRRDNVGVIALRVPDRVGVSESFALGITVGRTAGEASGDRTVAVGIWRDGLRVGPAALPIDLARGETRTVRVVDRVDGPGLVHYRVTLEGDPGPAEDDAAERWVRVGEEPVVLVVGEAPALPGCVRIDLQPAQAALWLADARRREGADAIVLAAPLLGREAQSAVAGLVDEGAGMIVLAPDGLDGGPLATILPLTERPPEGRALLVLLDYSGSMAPHIDALQAAVQRLRARFAPRDEVAAIAFRDSIVFETAWSATVDASWPMREHRPYGNTRLGPALLAARDKLAGVGARTRRVFVVSDGRWGDLEEGGRAALVAGCESLTAGGADLAALFVGRETPAEARALFPRTIESDADLTAALLELEDDAPDRLLRGPVQAVASAAPEWLGEGLTAGPYTDVRILFPRGAGERIFLRAGDRPLAAALESGGRVIQIAPAAGTNAALGAALPRLVRAVARPRAGGRIEVDREAGGLRVVGIGPSVADFVVAGRPLPARPTGFARREALLEDPPVAPFVIGWGDERRIVPHAEAADLAGLHSRPRIAAAIAAASGGRFYDVGQVPVLGDAPRPFPAGLLLPALLCLLFAAWARRGA